MISKDIVTHLNKKFANHCRLKKNTINCHVKGLMTVLRKMRLFCISSGFLLRNIDFRVKFCMRQKVHCFLMYLIMDLVLEPSRQLWLWIWTICLTVVLLPVDLEYIMAIHTSLSKLPMRPAFIPSFHSVVTVLSHSWQFCMIEWAAFGLESVTVKHTQTWQFCRGYFAFGRSRFFQRCK